MTDDAASDSSFILLPSSIGSAHPSATVVAVAAQHLAVFVYERAQVVVLCFRAPLLALAVLPDGRPGRVADDARPGEGGNRHGRDRPGGRPGARDAEGGVGLPGGEQARAGG